MGSLRSVVVRAIEEATSRGSRTVEAEDVLLALSSAGSPETRQTLAAAGLDHDSLLAALEAERLHNLAYLGIDPDLARQEPTAPRSGRPVWGTSVREALSRSHSVAGRAARNRRMSERDAIIGILLANFGTLPRALTLAGVQRDALIGALQRQNHP